MYICRCYTHICNPFARLKVCRPHHPPTNINSHIDRPICCSWIIDLTSSSILINYLLILSPSVLVVHVYNYVPESGVQHVSLEEAEST